MEIFKLKDVKLEHLLAVFSIRLFEMFFLAIGINKIFTLIILAIITAAEYLTLTYIYLDEGGVLTLKFVEMILLDNKRIKRRFAKYRISVEIEYLKEYYEEETHPGLEKMTRLMMFSMFLAKFLIYSNYVVGLGLSALQIGVISGSFVLIDIVRGVFALVKDNRGKKESTELIARDSKLLNNERMMIIMEFFVNLFIILGMFLPVIWNEELDQIDKDITYQPEDEIFNLKNGVPILGSKWHQSSLNVFTWIILRNIFTRTKKTYLVNQQYILNTIILSFMSIFYYRHKPGIGLLDLAKLALLQIGNIVVEYDRKRGEFIREYITLSSCLFCTAFFNEDFTPYDHIYTSAILFILSILRYKEYAVRLADFFNFMYRQLSLLALLYITFSFERMNFSGTEDIWNNLPGELHKILGKFMVYTILVIVVLLCVYHNDYVIEVPMDINSNEYYLYMLSIFTIRNVLGGKPADEVTKQKIAEVNGGNIYVLFVIGNFYFYENYFFCFMFNCAMIPISRYFFQVEGLDLYQLIFFLIKLAIRFAKPLIAATLGCLVTFVEKLGFEERGLKLAIFHLSDVSHFKSCSYYLPWFNMDTETFEYDCEFKESTLNQVMIILFCFHVLILIVTQLFKKNRSDPVIFIDFLLLFEEIISAAIFATGLFYGFYIDFTFISASIYIYLYRKRVVFDWDHA